MLQSNKKVPGLQHLYKFDKLLPKDIKGRSPHCQAITVIWVYYLIDDGGGLVKTQDRPDLIEMNEGGQKAHPILHHSPRDV